MKKIIIFIFKLLVSFSILIYYFSRIELSLYINIIKNTNITYFLLALFTYFFAVFIFTYKWKILLKMMEVDYGYLGLYKINLISMFYSTFLPGGFLAGETVKGYKISKNENNKTERIFSVILDRLTGVISFLLIGFLSFMISGFYVKKILLLYVFLFLGVLLIYFFLISAKPREKIKNFLKKRFVKYYRNFLDKDNYIKFNFINKAIIFGVIFQLVITLGLYFTVLSIGENINFLNLVWINALVSSVTMLPVSILGIGPREISFIYFFSFFGLAKVSSLGVATLSVLIIILRGIPGGVLELKNYLKSD